MKDVRLCDLDTQINDMIFWLSNFFIGVINGNAEFTFETLKMIKMLRIKNYTLNVAFSLINI